MSARPPSRLELEGRLALAALRRARVRAERVALATGTFLVEAKNGKPVLVVPQKMSNVRSRRAHARRAP